MFIQRKFYGPHGRRVGRPGCLDPGIGRRVG
jgi:hypothetical protein